MILKLIFVRFLFFSFLYMFIWKPWECFSSYLFYIRLIWTFLLVFCQWISHSYVKTISDLQFRLVSFTFHRIPFDLCITFCFSSFEKMIYFSFKLLFSSSSIDIEIFDHAVKSDESQKHHDFWEETSLHSLGFSVLIRIWPTNDMIWTCQSRWIISMTMECRSLTSWFVMQRRKKRKCAIVNR